jgi:ATP synthase protein I
MIYQEEMFSRHVKYILNLLALYAIGWGVTEYQSVFLGLALGTAVGLYNHWLMARKTKQIGQAVAEGKKFRSLGTLSRMAAAVFAVFVAMRNPDTFHLVSVIIGLMTPYLVIMIDFLIEALRSSGKER